MPRFDNEGFNPQRRIDNDSRDRSVPPDEDIFNPNRRVTDFTPQRSEEDDPVTAAEVQRRRREREERRRAAEEKKKKNKKKTVKTVVTAAVILILLIPALLATSVLGKINYDEKKPNAYVSASSLMNKGNVKNILLLGVDARPTQDTEQSHPDSMMLITVDGRHKCIKMTSFLRDTWVYLASRDKEQRLNTANQGVGYCGIVQSIEYLFGIKIDGYVVTDFQMFRSMVDSIGGVTIKVTKAEAKEINSHKGRYGNVKIKSGKRRLNGKQALAYARIRKIDTDFMRTKRQRTVITSILNEVKKNPFKLYKLANGAAPYLETDLSKAELTRIMTLALPCLGKDMPQARVPFEGTWEYANVGGASVIKINVEKNKELLIDYIYNKSAAELKEE